MGDRGQALGCNEAATMLDALLLVWALWSKSSLMERDQGRAC